MVDVASRRAGRLLPHLFVEGGLTLVALSLAAALSSAAAPVPSGGGVQARIADCVVSAGAAQITYVITNNDLAEHAYRVELTVDNGTTRIGSGVSLLPQVAPGSSATARAMVPTTVLSTVPTCTARAAVYYGELVGHHHR